MLIKSGQVQTEELVTASSSLEAHRFSEAQQNKQVHVPSKMGLTSYQ